MEAEAGSQDYEAESDEAGTTLKQYSKNNTVIIIYKKSGYLEMSLIW
jgi:hypothetical protein